jgi:AcrR family transcriptional regulator
LRVYEDVLIIASMNKPDKQDPAVRPPRHERGKARVASLKAAAMAVFADKGFDAATMTEIAREAGAAIGSLYQFFATKEQLATSLHGEMLEEMGDMLEALEVQAAQSTVAELVDRLFVELSDFLLARPAFQALAQRRDIDPERKRLTRAIMLAQITRLLTNARQPLPKQRAASVAVLLLELMKIRVGLDAGNEAVAIELRAMLRHHFA